MERKTILLVFLCFSFLQLSAQDIIKTNSGDITIQPITHGTLVLTYNNKTIYIDPYGGADGFKGIKKPDFILITDIHGDHLSAKTLDGLDTKKTQFIVPQAVADKIPEKYKDRLTVLENGQSIHRMDFYITAIPMYNLPEAADSKHTKGRGNGYIVNMAGKEHLYFWRYGRHSRNEKFKRYRRRFCVYELTLYYGCESSSKCCLRV